MQKILLIVFLMGMLSTQAFCSECEGVAGAFGYVSKDAVNIAKASLRYGQNTFFSTMASLQEAGAIVYFGGQSVQVIGPSLSGYVIKTQDGQLLITNKDFVRCRSTATHGE